MPKVRIDNDERYPYFSVLEDSSPCGLLCEFTEEEHRQILEAVEAFETAHDLMKTRYEETEKKEAENDPKAFAECPNCGYKPSMPLRVCTNCRYPQPGYSRMEPGQLRRRG